MKPPKVKPLKPADFLGALIQTAYLPKELPPIFTTKYYAKFCRSNYGYIKSQNSTLSKTSTSFSSFSCPRSNTGRRSLAVVHPLGQLAISLLITEHKAKIRKIIADSPTSLYKTNEESRTQRAFLGLDFEQMRVLTAKACSEYEFILRADISRFFYTIYTHSIPWAVIGKEKAKDWLDNNKGNLNAHWSHHLDRALQLCHSRETFGIPVGPDTSRIVAEILMAGIEVDPDLSPLLKDRVAARLVDDYVIGFEREDIAKQALAALRAALWKFNLQLNDEKTSITASRLVLREKWKLEHSAIQISDSDPIAQNQDILRLLEITLHSCAETNSDTPALYACQRLSRLKNVSDNFSLVLDVLF
jgi:hypothetical protein